MILKNFLQHDELTKINVIGDNTIWLWINSFWQALCASSVSQCKFILRVICRKHAPKRTNLYVRENPVYCIEYVLYRQGLYRIRIISAADSIIPALKGTMRFFKGHISDDEWPSIIITQLCNSGLATQSLVHPDIN